MAYRNFTEDEKDFIRVHFKGDHGGWQEAKTCLFSVDK